jgi:hypothetical protein
MTRVNRSFKPNASVGTLKADRDLAESDSAEVQLCIQKIRFRQVGRRGMSRLYYEPVCATYRHDEDTFLRSQESEV